MTRMPDFAREAAEAVFHHHHDQAAPSQAGLTHTITSTPQEPHMSKLADAKNAISDLADNPLIEQLAELGLGRKLQGHEIETVVNFVAGLEYPRTPMQAPQQQRAGEFAHSDAAMAQPLA